MVNKKYNYANLFKKLFGLFLMLIFFILAYLSIYKYRNFIGILLSTICIVIVDSLIKIYLPEK